MTITRRLVVVALLALATASCQQKLPKGVFALPPESLENRQLQTRMFESSDELKILNASAAVLQDIGFTLGESSSSLGVITGHKDRDAIKAGQVTVAVVAALFGVSTGPLDWTQKMRVNLVTHPIGDNGHQTAVRVNFRIVVFDINGLPIRAGSVEEASVYEEFFDKLSKSVFLEAHAL